MKGSYKRLKVVKQEVQLPVRSEDSGFGWYRKKCCESRCDDCGITNRFHAAAAAAGAFTASTSHEAQLFPCNCEFDCRDIIGNEIAVVVKVKKYVEQVRSGTAQKEMEEVEMTLPQCKKHFVKCMRKYLVEGISTKR
jgi:hypothetical protein